MLMSLSIPCLAVRFAILFLIGGAIRLRAVLESVPHPR